MQLEQAVVQVGESDDVDACRKHLDWILDVVAATVFGPAPEIPRAED